MFSHRIVLFCYSIIHAIFPVLWNVIYWPSLSLYFSDLAVGIFYVFPEILFNWFQLAWPHRYFCYFYYSYFSIVAYYASTYAIVVLTLDRLYVIKRPLAAAAEGKTYRYGLSISAWVIGLLLGIQYAVHTSYIEDSYCGHAIPYTRVSK